jgi:hypothetical protein
MPVTTVAPDERSTASGYASRASWSVIEKNATPRLSINAVSPDTGSDPSLCRVCE